MGRYERTEWYKEVHSFVLLDTLSRCLLVRRLPLWVSQPKRPRKVCSNGLLYFEARRRKYLLLHMWRAGITIRASAAAAAVVWQAAKNPQWGVIQFVLLLLRANAFIFHHHKCVYAPRSSAISKILYSTYKSCTTYTFYCILVLYCTFTAET